MTSLPQSAKFEGVGLPCHAPASPIPQFRVSAHRDVADVLDIWAELEASVPHSIYQTRKWLVPWIETIGAASGCKPFFVVLRDRFQAPIGLLPLGIVRRGPWQVAVFLGGKDSNFNMGLIRPEITVPPSVLCGLLREAAASLGWHAPDLYALRNQPLAWEGSANLLARLPHQPSPSFAYETNLRADADAYFADMLSKDTRKKLRKKENKLAPLGAVRYETARNDQDAQATLDTFFVQKETRLRAQHLASALSQDCSHAFYARTAAPSRGSETAVELHALYVGERIVATFGGSTYRNRFSGMVNSFDADAEIAKASPGDLLLTKLIAAKCAEGVTTFDLGIGEARYKAMFCPTSVPLMDCFVAVTMQGRVLRHLEMLRLRAKRAVKQNPRARRLIARLRALRPGI
jgi:CelD/BcsL family acetyltransferase involved in cellulose biosynthesis